MRGAHEEADAREAAEYLIGRLDVRRPALAIVLGSGLGGVADAIDDARSVAMEETPGFTRATVHGHAGRILCGSLGGAEVLVYQGRIHLYEGHEPRRVTLQARIAARLGVERLLLTNAAGSCDGDLPPGSLMRATDVVDLFFRRLRGSSAVAPRTGVLDGSLNERIDRAALTGGIDLHKGVLCGSPGPSYETAAEIRLWKRLGARAATMSTIPEAFAARRAGMRTAVISLITNYGTGIGAERLTHEDVVRRAATAARELRVVIEGLARDLATAG